MASAPLARVRLFGSRWFNGLAVTGGKSPALSELPAFVSFPMVCRLAFVI